MAQYTNAYNTQNGGGMGQVPGPYDQSGQPAMRSNGGGMMTYGPVSQPVYPPMDQAPPVLPVRGRLVESSDEISPQEIPMDLAPSFFPQKDYKVIHVKYWTRDGVLKNMRFVPEEQPQQGQTDYTQDVLNGFGAIASNISNRLDAMENRIENILRPFTSVDTTGKEGK